jgi:type II secretory ATPase GspE/PulE/Tfp pilus assembly ATPase PilB-like protein
MDDQNPSGVGEKLSKLKREGEERAAQRLAQQLNYQYIDIGKIPVSVEALKLIPEGEAREAKIAAVELKAKKVAVAAVDPRLPAAQKAIKELQEKKYEVRVFIASLSGLEEIWRSYRFIKGEVEGITGKVSIGEKFAGLLQKLKNLNVVQDTIKNTDFTELATTELIDTVLAGALANKASDIHLEAGEKKSKIRFRLDGILHDVFDEIPQRNYNSVISRIKLLSGMKINVRREAQDGRFTITLPDKEVEVRVSVIPAEFGETVVMRLLDPAAISVDLPNLGLREDDLTIVEKELEKPHGLILNTGPTGSGKTTTLYAFLRKLNSPEIKIITVEDPIEYRLEGIEQTQTDAEAGYTFASGLRAIVRQDPDVILVGEIRDLETADIAMQASLTGHMVLSTLHTNDAVGAVPRLINIGVKPMTIGPALTLVIAQRLVRKLCEKCRKPVVPGGELKAKIAKFLEKLPPRVKRENYAKATVFEAVGCEVCSGFGYKGRRGIFEFFQGGPGLESTILREISEIALKKLAGEQGMVTMQQDGVLKVLTGLTSFAEVESTTGPIEW